MERIRFPQKCPKCGSKRVIKDERIGFFKCEKCNYMRRELDYLENYLKYSSS